MTFAQSMVILRVNDIMAYSRISGDDIVSSILQTKKHSMTVTVTAEMMFMDIWAHMPFLVENL